MRTLESNPDTRRAKKTECFDGAKHEGADQVSGLLSEGACRPMSKLIGDATAVGSLRRPGIRIAIVWPGCGSAD
jgi:hypothetical protein